MRDIQNFFTHKVSNKSVTTKSKNAEAYAIFLVLITLLMTFSFTSANSLLANYVVIESSGRILTPMASPLTRRSEMRGVFVHCASFPADWNSIASTLSPYKIDAVFGEFLTSWGSQYNYMGQLPQAISALHSKGIQVWVSMDVLMGTWTSGTGVVLADGTYDDGWTCPTKQSSRNAIKAQVENLVRNYDIDGFMFDYIRYEGGDMCYCSDCKAKFIIDTGLTNVSWPTDVRDGGKYYIEFMEWRTVPITELVRDMRSWMLAIKPNLQFTIASWWIQSDSTPSYWRRWVGQDTALWIDRGYLDSVAPMHYADSATGFADDLRTDMKYFTGGSEGKIPYYALITDAADPNSGGTTPLDPATFRAIIDQVRLSGADGWIIWRYGGPGSSRVFPDIRNYLSQISLPATFEINNIKVSTNQNSATVTWDTSKNTTGRVEYSTSPLFIAQYRYDSVQGFHYYDIDHVQGTIINEQGNSTSHSINIPNLQGGQTVYFRVQSQDPSGICTSEVLNFTSG